MMALVGRKRSAWVFCGEVWFGWVGGGRGSALSLLGSGRVCWDREPRVSRRLCGPVEREEW